MNNEKPTRKEFIKFASMGLGALSVSPLTDETRKERLPQHLENKSGNRLQVLCLGAHPGDPEFGCGGTMAKFAKSGHEITFLYLTRGEAGDPGKSYAESAALRTKEAESSCKILHAKAVFAGQIDAHTILSRESNEEISKLILSVRPDLVFSQWPLDSHPDHQVAGMLALTTWIKSQKNFQLYSYEVNTGSETMWFSPTDYVDITEVRELKMQAMFAHKTQFPEETYNHYFHPMEEFRGLEAGVKAAEGFIHFADKSKSAFLEI